MTLQSISRSTLIILALCALAFGQANTSVLGGNAQLGGAAALGSAGAAPAFSYVGSASNNCHAVTTCAVTYSATAGNLIIVDIDQVDTTAASPPGLTTDNNSSTYVNEFASGLDPTGNYYFNEDASLAVASGVTAITAHLNATVVSSTVTVTEYHRPSGSWLFGSVTALHLVASPSTSQTCTSLTPTASISAVVSGHFYTSAQDPFLTSGVWTLRATRADIFAGDEAGTTSQVIATTSGAYAAAATNGTSVTYECFASYYK